jgi:hypothetical protein
MGVIPGGPFTATYPVAFREAVEDYPESCKKLGKEGESRPEYYQAAVEGIARH